MRRCRQQSTFLLLLTATQNMPVASALEVFAVRHKHGPVDNCTIQVMDFGRSYHEAGTLRMGTSKETCATDETGRMYGIDNLYAADASLFPCVGIANPMLTITALAYRVADCILSNLSGKAFQGPRPSCSGFDWRRGQAHGRNSMRTSLWIEPGQLAWCAPTFRSTTRFLNGLQSIPTGREV